MNRKVILLIAAVCTALNSNSRAWADTTPAAPPPQKSVSTHLAKVPIAIAGFCAALVVGTPICFVRKFGQEVSEGAHGIVGSFCDKTDNKFLLIPAGMVWLPFAGFVTTIEAPAYALRDAWMADKPFSKEQFSLGEIEQPSR